MRVITQDNLWFTGPPRFENYRRRGRRMISVDPLLGRTASSDPEAKSQELQWLLRYTGRTGSGLVVAQQWTRPTGRISRNLPAWLDLFERHGRRARWVIFYDPVLALFFRLGKRPPLDFGTADALAVWKSDLDHLAPFFEGDRYFRLGGRPVLYVWAVHGGIFNAGRAFGEADRRGLYVLGDVFGGGRRPANLRGATGFTSVIPGLGQQDHELVDVVPRLEEEFRRWSGDLPTIPAASMQYDDTEFQAVQGTRRPSRILARSRDDLRLLLGTLRRAAGPRGHVFLGTANNWAEGTTLLPTIASGPEFGAAERMGQYHFAHLEVLREVLFPGVRRYRGPRFRLLRSADQPTVRVDLIDADHAGRLTVTPQRGLRSMRTLAGFQRRLEVEPGTRVAVRNLDGREAAVTA